MCGIAGYIGKRNALSVVVEGLSRLEYRGYDSAGVAAHVGKEIAIEKQVGKVAALKQALEKKPIESHLAVAHTRWATHGKPTQENAHPHPNQTHDLVVVHNGIIENHLTLRRYLEGEGITFLSDTDTEVIAQLIGLLYKGDFLFSVKEAIPKLDGTFAIAVMHKDHPDEIVVAAKESPLCVGVGKDEMFVASDPAAFLPFTQDVIYLHGSEVAKITASGVEVFDADLAPVQKTSQRLEEGASDLSKGQYSHYMLKEIFEQPQTIGHAMLSRYCDQYGTAILDEIELSDRVIRRIVILACGTSYHAGLIGAQMIEELARIPVQVEMSSEFRYRNPIIFDHTLVVAISQSGETADTLAAMRELREKGAHIIGLCNVQNSTMTREVDGCLFLRAGPEIGVASTKAFTSQLVVLSLLALKLARMRVMSQAEGQAFLEALKAIPNLTREVLNQRDHIADIAARYAEYENVFYLGRRYMYAMALEGALKLKEIAYVNANGYAAGEMKHGPIALIDPKCPTVACLCDQVTFNKALSNLREVKAREGKIIAIAPEGSTVAMADDIIYVPQTRDEFAPILTTVATQLLAYEIAAARHCEIDQPRNLAKSVTVE